MSKKRAKVKAATDGPRKAFVEAAGVCMVCRYRKAVDCHEIARGTAREKALRLPRLWLAVCRNCHGELDDTKMFPPAKQIAMRIQFEIFRSLCDYVSATGRGGFAAEDVELYIGGAPLVQVIPNDAGKRVKHV